MARGNAGSSKVTTLEPPKIKRGKRGSSIPDDVLDKFQELLDKGESPTDGNVYRADSTSDKDMDKARQAANSVAARFKKALVNREGSPYEELKQLRSRVWDNDGKGGFVFVLQVRDTVESEGESDDS